MKTKLRNISLTLLVATIASSCGKEVKPTLETVEVTRGELSETVTATGTIESVTQVDVGTQVTGIINNLYADYNSIVKKGELIAEIEKTMLESDLKSAEASVESARLTYEYNQTNYKRDKALHDKQLISDYEFQTTEKELNVSRQAYEKAQADKVRAAKNLNYAEIYSPIDGIVISREVEVGQTVVSNMNVANLFTIADLDHMQVIGNVDEADIGQVKVNQYVTFTVDAFPDQTFSGSVTQVRLSPTTENNVVTYEVVVSAENPDHKLIPGLTANLTIHTMNYPDVLLLPVKAFAFQPQTAKAYKSLPQPADSVTVPQPGENQKCVWVVKEGKLIPTLVTIGESNGIMTRIDAGVDAGTKIAVGYSTSSQMPATQDGEQSPFAPRPPGKKK